MIWKQTAEKRIFMEFRPCIDIHNGKVKQIVGASLQDESDRALDNFVSEKDAAFYAELYKSAGIRGGHVILLNAPGSAYYEATKRQALSALEAYPGGLQAGGGITPENAGEYLDAGASHVIVTSYVFRDGKIHYENLKKMVQAVGRERLVLDVSCRRRGQDYFVVTDRWQKLSQEKVDSGLLSRLAEYCDEFLIHGVDVEGHGGGIERELVRMLGSWKGIPITYAGGVGSFGDIALLRELGEGRIHVTVGSALDLFGGELEWRRVLAMCQ